jgi:hypothetical protein
LDSSQGNVPHVVIKMRKMQVFVKSAGTNCE